MSYRFPRLGVIVLGVLACLLVVIACSSSDSTPNTSSTGAATGTGAVTGTGAASTATPGTGLATAGPELSAYHLLDAAGYTAALGEPVTAVEDDGVVPDRYGCEIGQARALTAAGVLITTTLRTADSTDNAKQEYSNETNLGSTPILLNVGDQSASVDSLALVQKGAQVLRVVSEIAPGVDPKAATGDPTAALAAAAAVAGKAAPALAGKMTGQTCDGPAIGIPAGGTDPCESASDLQSELGISGVSSLPVISDEPPALECIYTLGDQGTYTVYSATDALYRASVIPTTAAAAFASREQARTNPRNAADMVQTFDIPPFQGFGSTAPHRGMDNEVLYQATNGDAALLREDKNPSDQEGIKADTCEALMRANMIFMFHDAQSIASPAFEDTIKKLTDYCKAANGASLSE